MNKFIIFTLLLVSVIGAFAEDDVTLPSDGEEAHILPAIQVVAEVQADPAEQNAHEAEPTPEQFIPAILEKPEPRKLIKVKGDQEKKEGRKHHKENTSEDDDLKKRHRKAGDVQILEDRQAGEGAFPFNITEISHRHRHHRHHRHHHRRHHDHKNTTSAENDSQHEATTQQAQE